MHRPPPLAETVAAFDRRSASYDESRMHHCFAQQAAAAADAQPRQTLLDLAGGTGLTARAALRDLGDGRAVVADASPGMLVAARRAEPRLLLLIADAHRLPLRDEAVHRVTCVTALHLFAEPLRALREAVRVTRRGGRVVFTTWAAGGWSSGRRLREAAAAQGLACHDPNERTGTPEAARALAIAAGLADVQVAHCRHTEPLAESEGVWERLLATAQARPVRAAPPQVQQRVREAVEQDLASEEHVVLLVTGTPQTSMPRR